MTTYHDDHAADGANKDLSRLNIRKIPDKKTAVALKGAEGGKKVPKVAAAGRGHVAEKILQLAFDNGIAVREDSNLAELLTSIELDSPIPTEAFVAVGEILYYVYRANGQKTPLTAL
ncbi:MAG: EscU/YscU/HrcU family type III secretion system export apparatus switch protein [Alphaproteobacteria bacterium]